MIPCACVAALKILKCFYILNVIFIVLECVCMRGRCLEGAGIVFSSVGEV